MLIILGALSEEQLCDALPTSCAQTKVTDLPSTFILVTLQGYPGFQDTGHFTAPRDVAHRCGYGGEHATCWHVGKLICGYAVPGTAAWHIVPKDLKKIRMTLFGRY